MILIQLQLTIRLRMYYVVRGSRVIFKFVKYSFTVGCKILLVE